MHYFWIICFFKVTWSLCDTGKFLCIAPTVQWSCVCDSSLFYSQNDQYIKLYFFSRYRKILEMIAKDVFVPHIVKRTSQVVAHQEYPWRFVEIMGIAMHFLGCFRKFICWWKNSLVCKIVSPFLKSLHFNGQILIKTGYGEWISLYRKTTTI